MIEIIICDDEIKDLQDISKIVCEVCLNEESIII